ncbi:unnamed protein product [Somion occarium]|uniref:Cleavage stimulation factor subunit 2 hinge domain-containing protein n=1 Tax=Somion occarium TaxID=3059160 RepID=A0ABP1CJA5_9APHY
MSTQAMQENQLLELLLQLKKTTPEQARSILNVQPQIAYALMAVMVNIDAIDVDVVQRTVAAYSAGPSAPSIPAMPTPATSISLPPQMPVAPAIPPHLTNHTTRGATPPYPPPSSVPPHMATPPPQRQATPTYPSQAPAYPQQGYSQQMPPQNQYGGMPPGLSQPQYGAPTPSRTPSYGSQQPAPPAWQAALALIPEEQRPLLTRVANMTPQEIHQLPPQERNSYIQLRATLGIPT